MIHERFSIIKQAKGLSTGYDYIVKDETGEMEEIFCDSNYHEAEHYCNFLNKIHNKNLTLEMKYNNCVNISARVQYTNDNLKKDNEKLRGILNGIMTSVSRKHPTCTITVSVDDYDYYKNIIMEDTG